MIFCQNLINNPSFETIINCPTAPSQVNDYCANWYLPTSGTSDFFNVCAGTSCPSSYPLVCVPENSGGWQMPHSGNGYLGFFTFIPGSNYREYLQTKLNQKLIKNETYLISFYVSLGDLCYYSTNSIGFVFTNDSIFQDNNNPIPLVPNYAYPDTISDKIGWTKICHSYLAKGGENYFTIGLFADNVNTLIQTNSFGTSSSSYYYLDDVEVIKSTFIIATPDSSLCDNEPVQLTINNSQNLSFVWSEGTTENSIQVNDFGEYWVELNDDECVYKDYFIQYEEECIQKIEMPNVFTPNSDGVNDFFIPIDINEIDKCEFTVINRWGNIIYQSDNLNKGWNGETNGLRCADGIYFWRIKFSDFDGNDVFLQGNVSLIK